MSAKAGRRKNKTIPPIVDTNGSTLENVTPPSPTKPVQASASLSTNFAQSASDILSPNMSDIEKLQKLKEWILADQHPYFTSAPKVAHLLSLRIHPAHPLDSTASFSGTDGTVGAPLSLQDRMGLGPEKRDSLYTLGNYMADIPDPNRSVDASGAPDISIPPPDDTEMADSNLARNSGNMASTGGARYGAQGAYSRPNDSQRRNYNNDVGGRRSPRGDYRHRGSWEGNQRSYDDSNRYPSGPYNRFGDGGGPGERSTGSYRGYNNPNRRPAHFHNDRQQLDRKPYDNEYERRDVSPPRWSGNDRFNARLTATKSEPDVQADNFVARGEFERPSAGDRASVQQDEARQPIETNTSDGPKVKEEEEVAIDSTPLDNAQDITNAVTTESETKPEISNTSPTSPLATPPLSGGEPAPPISNAPSPKSESLQDSRSLNDTAAGGSLGTPRPPANPLNDREGRPREDMRQSYPPRDSERYAQDLRARVEPYGRYPHNRNYDRSHVPPRDDRRQDLREPFTHDSRPAYAAQPPLEDRRYIPRDASYHEEPKYPLRKDYRPAADWEDKRRDDYRDRGVDRFYDRERNVRGPVPHHADVRDTAPYVAGSRGYVPERDREIGRGIGSRPLADSYPGSMSHHDPRAYDRDPYIPPIGNVSGPPYIPPRDNPRVRPRSMSPRRIDYDRPPAKRPRGPDDVYAIPPGPGGPYPPATYGPGRGHDYSADRRPNHPPLPSGGPGAYYRGGEPAVPRY